jgi:hypothetical protein
LAGLRVGVVEFSEESVDHVRVELGTRAAAELVARLGLSHRGRVGPRGNHRVECVAREHNSGGQRDLLSPEATSHGLSEATMTRLTKDWQDEG